MDEVRLEGLDDLDKAIQSLVKSVSPDVAEPILLDGAKQIRDEAKRLAPVGPTGNLKKSPVAKLLGRRAEGLADVSGFGEGKASLALAGLDRKKAPHAWLVEYGSPARYAEKGKYPGRYYGPMPANPFFRNAWDMNKNRVREEIIQKLQDSIERSV